MKDEMTTAMFALVDLATAMPDDILEELDALEQELRSKPVAVGSAKAEWTSVIGRLVVDGSPGFHDRAEDWSLATWTPAEIALLLERCLAARQMLQRAREQWSPSRTLLVPRNGVTRFHWLLGEQHLHLVEVQTLSAGDGAPE